MLSRVSAPITSSWHGREGKRAGGRTRCKLQPSLAPRAVRGRKRSERGDVITHFVTSPPAQAVPVSPFVADCKIHKRQRREIDVLLRRFRRPPRPAPCPSAPSAPSARRLVRLRCHVEGVNYGDVETNGRRGEDVASRRPHRENGAAINNRACGHGCAPGAIRVAANSSLSVIRLLILQ